MLRRWSAKCDNLGGKTRKTRHTFNKWNCSSSSASDLAQRRRNSRNGRPCRALNPGETLGCLAGSFFCFWSCLYGCGSVSEVGSLKEESRLAKYHPGRWSCRHGGGSGLGRSTNVWPKMDEISQSL